MVLTSALFASCLLIAGVSAEARYGYPDRRSTRIPSTTTIISSTSAAVPSSIRSTKSRASSAVATSQAGSQILPSSSGSSRSGLRPSSSHDTPSASASASGSASVSRRPSSVSQSAAASTSPRSSSLPGTVVPSSGSAACPAFTPSATTVYNVIDIYLTTTYVTLTVPYTETITDSTAIATVIEFGGSTTITTTYTTTWTSVEVVPAATTITVPTPPGFTPVACLPEYHQPTITETVTRTNGVDTSYVPITGTETVTTITTSYASVYTSSIILSDTSTSVIFPFPTTIVTSTRREATRTVYEACATNNVVNKRLYGGYVDRPQQNVARNASTGLYYSLTDTVNAYVVDAEDCCAQCQANSSCTNSYWERGFDPVNSSFPQQAYPPRCLLFIKNPALDQACDPSFKGATLPTYTMFDGVYISNGACGQIDMFPYES